MSFAPGTRAAKPTTAMRPLSTSDLSLDTLVPSDDVADGEDEREEGEKEDEDFDDGMDMLPFEISLVLIRSTCLAMVGLWNMSSNETFAVGISWARRR